MRHFRKHNGGFTLVELVVSIAVASIVTAAATSVLLLALRVNRQSSDTASQQNTVRALLTTMENAAADGNIKGLISNFDSWQLMDHTIERDENGKVISTGRIVFGFDSKTQTIYTNGEIVKSDETGETVYKIETGTPVINGIYASSASLDGNLLTLSVETQEGSYSSSIWCRLDIASAGDVSDGNTAPIVPDEPELQPDPGNGTIQKFLSVLKSQYGSRGEIIYTEAKNLEDPTYYSEWYIGLDYDDTMYDNGWNSKTPWCACFVSWALEEAGIHDPTDRTDAKGRAIHWFAEVDDFVDFFQKNGFEEYQQKWLTDASQITAGNLIFFDWITDDDKDDAQHVGVVLSVTDTDGNNIDDTVYTIEGNSAGRVAIRSYSINDERILGYGDLGLN